MHYKQKFGLMLTIVCALGVVAVPSAYASSFLAHSPGKVLIKALSTHIFKTGGFETVCTGVSNAEPESVAGALQALTLEIHTQYSNCNIMGVQALVSPARWLYSADNGLVRLLNIFTIRTDMFNCTITILSAANQDLWTAKYLNIGREIAIDHNIANLSAEGAGECAFAQENKGTYTGVTLVALEGLGTLKWDQD
jgi:hypothetical protein